jgi:phosphoribosylformylglycinamidine synthase subunit PurS
VKRFRARVRVMPRPSLLDPQGQAVSHALGELGFRGVAEVRVGRTVEVVIEAATADAARDGALSMCERLLANPVTEDFTLETVEPA